MNLTYYIQHPEALDKATLHELRTTVAAHPTHQVARLLMLQNLYLLHDPTFDEEMRRAAIYITDRNVIFNMVEAVHHSVTTPAKHTVARKETHRHSSPEPLTKPSAVALATNDYASYLLTQSADDDEDNTIETAAAQQTDGKDGQTRQQQLINDFISQSTDSLPHIAATDKKDNESAVVDTSEQPQEEEGFFTETLARIYIKQGRYDKALQIIRQLNLNYPEKSRYFADQIRFLEKLVINQSAK